MANESFLAKMRSDVHTITACILVFSLVYDECVISSLGEILPTYSLEIVLTSCSLLREVTNNESSVRLLAF